MTQIKPRVAYRANEGYVRRDPVDGIRFHVARIVENESGWSSAGSYSKPENAVEQAKFLNRLNGITESDALEIEINSMRVSGVI